MGFETPTQILENTIKVTDEDIFRDLRRLQDRIKAIIENKQTGQGESGMSQEEKVMTPNKLDRRLKELEDLERKWRGTLGKGEISRELWDTRHTF